MEWTPTNCRQLAQELIGDLGDRWVHVQGVADTARSWVAADRTSEGVLCAAWLHDIGYASHLGSTGMHAIDGAAYLNLLGVPREIVALVAFHTGAEYEADERGLLGQLTEFDRPDQHLLDLVTFADLVTGPTGDRVGVSERIDEILGRYEPQHPVHRGVLRSRAYLEECCRRAAARVGYPM